MLLLISTSYVSPLNFFIASANPCVIVPITYPHLRRFIYVIAIAITSLGIAASCVWVFQCQPFLSNFIFEVSSDWCADISMLRYCKYL